MNESEAAVLNTDRDFGTGDSSNQGRPIEAASICGSAKATSPDGIKSTELVKENKKWRKKVVKGDENSCSAINRLAIKIELKSSSEESNKNKIEYSLPALQNGNTNSPESFICSLCGAKFLTEPELESHVKCDHSTAVSQPSKTVKTPKPTWERMHYLCFSCKGRPFLSKSSLHRHIAQHVTLPEVRLSRLKEDKTVRTIRSESPEEPPSGRPQVALKRVTISCHERSPLKFLFKLTSDPTSKDTFKVVKATKGIREGVEGKADVTDNRESFELRDQKTLATGSPEIIETFRRSPQEDSLDSLKLVLEDDQKETSGKKVEGQGAMVEASHDQCSVPLVEEPIPDSPKGTVGPRESEDKAGSSEVIHKEIMRPSKNGEGDMDKIQSNSPSVVVSPAASGQVLLEKNGLSSNNVDVSEEPEFIPLERLDQGTAAQIIEKSSRESVFDNSSREKETEATILCEACGESVPGDQTALEDHCLCRGHYKCPVCSVACASSDALAVHTEETHQNKDTSGKTTEKKKKSSSLRSVRRKHQELSKDPSIDLNSEISLPSPPGSENSNSMPSGSTRTSENSQPAFSIRIAEVTQQAAKTSDRRMSPPSQQSTAASPVIPQAGSVVRMPPLQNAPNRARVPETIPPPPLTRPPNLRNMESQPRGNVPNVTMGEPMQPPPALYKMPTTTSHGMTSSQLGMPAVSTNMAYPRGIPASGYQTEPPNSAASNLAATLSSRYQTMHPGYPTPGQAPSYAPYPPSMQMQRASMMPQQRFQMGPPPPYSSQMLHSQGPRVPGMSQEAYLTNSQQAYNQSLLKAHLEQARMQGLPQSSSMLQSMQTLQQEHYQQQQLQKQLFQQQNHPQMMQAQQPEQNQGQAAQVGQKRKSVGGNPTGQIRYQHQNALNSQQTLQNQLQQNSGTPVKQRRLRENIGIPSKQTDSDCEIIAVQQRGEGVPVIQSIQGANTSSTSAGGDGPMSSGQGVSVSQTTPESTIHLTDSITLSVRQPPGVSATSAGSRSNNASAVASILATRGITVTPASGSIQQPRTANGQQRSRPSPPPNRGPAVSPPQPVNSQQTSLNSSVSISHSSRQPSQHSNDGFAVPAPVGPAQRQAPRQIPPDRPPRPPTVDLTDENANQSHPPAATVSQCRLCDKQFPSAEALKNHMQVIHQTRNYFRCTVCNTKHSSQHALANHMKRVHKFSGNPNPAELVIPLVDLRNPNSVNRLNSLGVRHVISLSQLGMNSETGSFCIPIMSLDNNGASSQQRASTLGGLMAMGTTAVLPIGPVKSLPSAQAPSHSAPQTVPAATAPPPLAPIRPPHPPNQYMAPAHQMPPR